MNEKTSYALVGIFVLLLGGALIGATVWLGFAGEGRAYSHYVAIFNESVSGLDVKASVKYRGVVVGRVGSISLVASDPSRVRVALEIEAGTPMKSDTYAVLSSQGLTGIAHVELGGGSEGDDLSGGSIGDPTEIATGPSLFVRMDEAVSTLLDEMRRTTSYLNTVADRVNTLLATQNIDATNQTLENVRRLTSSLAEHAAVLSGAVNNVNRLSGEAADMTAELPKLVVQVRETLAAFDSTAKAIAGTANTLDNLAMNARRDLRDVAKETLPEVSAAVAEVRVLAQTLNRLAQALERDPSMLIRGRSNQAPGPGE